MPAFPLPPDPNAPVGEPTGLYYIANHVEAATSRLLEQMKGKPRIAALVESWTIGYQHIEDALWDLLINRTVDNAVGTSLDVLGRIVGADKRAGENDDDYRVIVRIQIAVNRSDGGATAVQNILILLFGVGGFTYAERYPAALLLTVTGALSTNPYIVANKLRKAVVAGVAVQLVTSPADPSTVFQFASTPNAPEVSHSQGWGSEYDSTVGGVLAEVAIGR